MAALISDFFQTKVLEFRNRNESGLAKFNRVLWPSNFPESRVTVFGMATSTPVTLGDLIHEAKLLWVYCLECCRERDVDPKTIPLPKSFPVPKIGGRMKCTACGSRQIDTRPELYPGGVVAQRKKFA